LDVDGANLYFEVEGSGPYLLCVPGANGDADIWKNFRAASVDHFTVVLYDRRGFSRSKLTGPQDYTHRLDTDAADIFKMMSSLTKEKFFILGNSSGAVVTLNYATKYPDTVSKCIVYEAPLLTICPNHEELTVHQLALYDTYKKEGRAASMKQFMTLVSFRYPTDSKIITMGQTSTDEQRLKNAEYWFEHELRQYPLAKIDENAIKSVGDKLIFACGEENHVGDFLYGPSTALSKLTGSEILVVPGGHLGFLTNTKEFAVKIRITKNE